MSLYIFFLPFLFNNIFALPYCKTKENFCIKCNPLTNLCVKCENDALIPDKNGGCIGAKQCKLDNNYCNECDLKGELCQKCEKGYFPDKNGGCSYTDHCSLSNKGECFECEIDYILVGVKSIFKICKYLYSDDLKNCKNIDNEKGICDTCEDGYFLNEGDKKCIKIQNCNESLYGNCISCDAGFYLNKKENTCEMKVSFLSYCKQSLDGKKCEICNEYSYLSEDGICVLSNYCSESDYEKCKKCISNYYLASNFVCSNTDNCFDADKDTGICNKCQNNYYLDINDYKCKSNQENNDFKFCQKVINNECIECIQLYKLSKDLKCTSSNNCLEAKNGECLLCENGYHLGLDNRCSNIEHCIYSNIYGECLECEDNYYYNKLTKNCIESNEKFKNCKYSEGFNCCECKNNYYLNLNDSTCLDNTQQGPFYKCAFGNNEEGYCNQCIKGYFLGSLDKRCSLISDCKISEDENTCIECDEYYCLDVNKGICVENDSIEEEKFIFYINCIKTNKEGTECEKCIDGYEVGKEGYCKDVKNCIEENDDGECLKCNDEINDNGFYFCANKLFGCIEFIHEGCSRCDDLLNLYNCTECKEGYYKSPGYLNCNKN